MKYYTKRVKSYKQMGVKQRRKLLFGIIAFLVLCAVVGLSVSANAISSSIEFRKTNPAVSFSQPNFLDKAESVSSFDKEGMLLFAAKKSSLKYLTDKNATTYWAPVLGNMTEGEIIIEYTLSESKNINVISLSERDGCIKSFRIEVSENGEWGADNSYPVYFGDEIGLFRLCTFDEAFAKKIRIVLVSYEGDNEKNAKQDKGVKLTETGAYFIEEKPEGFMFSTIEDITGTLDARPSRLLGSDRHKKVRDQYSALDQIIITNAVKLDAAYTPSYMMRDLSFSESDEYFIFELNNLKTILKRGAATYRTNLLMDFVMEIPENAKNDNYRSLIAAMVGVCSKFYLNGVNITALESKNDKQWEIFNDFCAAFKNYCEESGNNLTLSVCIPEYGLNSDAKNAVDQIQEYCFEPSFSAITAAISKYKRHDVIDKVVLGIGTYGVDADGNKLTTDKRLSDYELTADEVKFKINFGDTAYPSPSVVRDKTIYAELWGAKGVVISSLYYDYFIPLEDEGSLTAKIIGAIK